MKMNKKEKLSKDLQKLIDETTGARYVIDFFKKHGEMRILGGAIRDTYLGNNVKDIDICIDMSEPDLIFFIKEFNYGLTQRIRRTINKFRDNDCVQDLWIHKNQMHGYKIFVNGSAIIDIWSTQLAKADNLSDLHKTTVASCNMITYCPVTEKFEHIPDYFDLLDNKDMYFVPENQDQVFHPAMNVRKNYLLGKIGALERQRHTLFTVGLPYVKLEEDEKGKKPEFEFLSFKKRSLNKEEKTGSAQVTFYKNTLITHRK